MENKLKKIVKYFLLVLMICIGFGLLPNPIKAQETDPVECNCVKFARTKIPSLPSGLLTTASKQAIINTLFPRVGSAAIFSYNHIGVVTNAGINPSGEIIVSLIEANYSPCKIAPRTGTLRELQIVGFFDPAYSPGSSFPQIIQTSTNVISAGQPATVTVAAKGVNTSSIRAVILGGSYCTGFDKCQIPSNAIQAVGSNQYQIPLQLNERANFTLYLFDSSNGKSSNGAPLAAR